MKSKPQKKLIQYAVYAFLVVAVMIVVGYSLQQYYREGAEEGILVCDTRQCIKTVHIHADIDFDLCGQTYELPREAGPLDGVHAHKENSRLHFHDKLQLDPGTKEQKFDKRLTIQELVDTFELDPKRFCKGSGEVKTKIFINGAEPPQGLQYNWKDGDKIRFIYQQ